MIKGKRVVAWVLAAIVLTGLGGCGKAQSGVTESGVSGKAASFVGTVFSIAYIPQDRFEDANIINTECTRDKLSKSPVTGKNTATSAWAMRFLKDNFSPYSPTCVTAKPVYGETKTDFMLVRKQEIHRFQIDTYFMRFWSEIPLKGLAKDESGFYGFNLQLVSEVRSDCLTLLGYVTSQTDQITTEKDLAEFLSVIPAYRDLQYHPKSTVPESGWFGEGPLTNVAYTRASLSENPVISNDSCYSTIIDWVDLYLMGNYNSFSSILNPSFSETTYTLNTVDGEKEYFSTVICNTEFNTDIVPEGLEYDFGSYQICFQMVIKTSEIYNEGPFALLGFVTNQDRQIVEARELYDFVKGIPGYKDTDFIAPEPLKLIHPDTLGYDFTEIKVDDASNLSVVNLRSLTDGLEVDDFEFFPNDLLAVLAVNPDVKNEKVLKVYKAEDMRFLYQKTFSDLDAGYVIFRYVNGTPVLVQTPDDENYQYFIPTESGVSEIPEPKRIYRLSDTANIVDEKNCLYLEQNGVRKLLLEGFYPEDPEDDDTDWENYNFFCRISDTRFIYEKYGYEWYDECGIYDITTGEKTVFTHENAPLLNIVSYKDGKALLVADEWSDYDSYGPYLYDELTRELIDLDLLDIIPDESAVHPRLCLYGNTLAIFTEDDPITTFSLYDLSSKSEIMHFNFLSTRGYTQKRYYYTGGLYATENYIWFNSVYEFPADYLLRIPIKR